MFELSPRSGSANRRRWWHRERRPDIGADCTGQWAGAVRRGPVDRPFCARSGTDRRRGRKAGRQPAEYLHRRLAGLQTRHLRGLADRTAAPQPDPGRGRGQDRRAFGQLFQPGRRSAPGEGFAGIGDLVGDDHRHAGPGRPQRGRHRRHPRQPDRHAGRGAGGSRQGFDPPPALSADVDGAPPRTGLLARGADRRAHHLPDRLHHLAAGHLPFPPVRRRYLRRRHARRAGAARDRRADRGDHGGRPFGQRLHRRTRLDEDARGDRRAAHHGLRSDRGADRAAPAGADASRCRC